MKKESLSQIENYYKRKRYEGEELRKILQEDERYQKLLKERKNELSRNYDVSLEERRKYVLSVDQDFEILNKCKKLEEKALKEKDEEIVRLIKSQLKHDWRKPLSTRLDELLSKYGD